MIIINIQVGGSGNIRLEIKFKDAGYLIAGPLKTVLPGAHAHTLAARRSRWLARNLQWLSLQTVVRRLKWHLFHNFWPTCDLVKRSTNYLQVIDAALRVGAAAEPEGKTGSWRVLGIDVHVLALAWRDGGFSLAGRRRALLARAVRNGLSCYWEIWSSSKRVIGRSGIWPSVQVFWLAHHSAHDVLFFGIFLDFFFPLVCIQSLNTNTCWNTASANSSRGSRCPASTLCGGQCVSPTGFSGDSLSVLASNLLQSNPLQ